MWLSQFESPAGGWAKGRSEPSQGSLVGNPSAGESSARRRARGPAGRRSASRYLGPKRFGRYTRRPTFLWCSDPPRRPRSSHLIPFGRWVHPSPSRHPSPMSRLSRSSRQSLWLYHRHPFLRSLWSFRQRCRHSRQNPLRHRPCRQRRRRSRYRPLRRSRCHQRCRHSRCRFHRPCRRQRPRLDQCRRWQRYPVLLQGRQGLLHRCPSRPPSPRCR